MRKLLTAFFVTLVVAAPAAAQDYKPYNFNIGFGWTIPSGDFKNSFNTGWNGGIGFTYNLNPHLGVMAEYIYNRMDGPTKNILLSATPVAAALTSGIIESNHQTHVGSFNVVYHAEMPDRPVGFYVLGGLGIYHRIVQLTSPSVGYTTYCDPYWYVCYPAAVPIDLIIGDRSSNDFGIDFGGGVTFGHQAKIYVETRYHYVWGPTVTTTGVGTQCAGGCSTNASYVPITIGVKW